MKALIVDMGRRLEGAGIAEPMREAELMVLAISGISRAALYRDDPEVEPKALDRVKAAFSRRLMREPIQYVLGEVGFHGLHIAVGPGVLIPRPETELLAEEALALIQGVASPRVLDLCTGSGCLALAIAHARSDSSVVGTDRSEEALAYAITNAARNGIANAELLAGDLFAPVEGRMFDLIVSNPPYIAHEDVEALASEVRDWEPREALDGGMDGMDFYREIVAFAPAFLAPGGAIALELGAGQALAVEALADRAMPGAVLRIIRDYAGIERILVIRTA